MQEKKIPYLGYQTFKQQTAWKVAEILLSSESVQSEERPLIRCIIDLTKLDYDASNSDEQHYIQKELKKKSAPSKLFDRPNGIVQKTPHPLYFQWRIPLQIEPFLESVVQISQYLQSLLFVRRFHTYHL